MSISRKVAATTCQLNALREGEGGQLRLLWDVHRESRQVRTIYLERWWKRPGKKGMPCKRGSDARAPMALASTSHIHPPVEWAAERRRDEWSWQVSSGLRLCSVRAIAVCILVRDTPGPDIAAPQSGCFAAYCMFRAWAVNMTTVSILIVSHSS